MAPADARAASAKQGFGAPRLRARKALAECQKRKSQKWILGTEEAGARTAPLIGKQKGGSVPLSRGQVDTTGRSQNWLLGAKFGLERPRNPVNGQRGCSGKRMGTELGLHLEILRAGFSGR